MEFHAVDRRLEGDTTLRQCQLTQLYLLDVFVEICRKHNLQYFLDSGTLLGAFRHNGFIPWDDDIDVCMPIEDYRKFAKVAPLDLPGGMLLEKPGEYPGEYSRTLRLRDCSSFFCEWYTRVENPSGIFIDIFPFSKVPRLPRSMAKRLNCFYGIATFNEQAHRVYPNRTIFTMPFHFAMAVLWKIVVCTLKSLHWLLGLIFPKVYSADFDATLPDYIGISEGDLFPLSEHVFEGKMYSVPKNSDRYLTLMYGDWRTPPPLDKRGSWHKTTMILPTQAPKVWWAMPYEGESSAGE